MNEEIPEKVSEYLQGGQAKMSKFYHLLKTHKIPIEQQNPKDWLKRKDIQSGVLYLEEDPPLRGWVG